MRKDCPRFRQRGIANLGWVIGLVFLGLLLPASVQLARQEQRVASQAEGALYPHGKVKTQQGASVIGSRVTVIRAYDGKTQTSPRSGRNLSEYWLVGFSGLCSEMMMSADVLNHQVIGFEYQGQFVAGQTFSFDPCVSEKIDIIVAAVPLTPTPPHREPTVTPGGPTGSPGQPTPTGYLPTPSGPTPPPGCNREGCYYHEQLFTDGGNYCEDTQRYVCRDADNNGCYQWEENPVPCSVNCVSQCIDIYGAAYSELGSGVNGVCSPPGLPDSNLGCSHYTGGGLGWGNTCVTRNYLPDLGNTPDCADKNSICKCYTGRTTDQNCAYSPSTNKFGPPFGENDDPCDDAADCTCYEAPATTPPVTITPTTVVPTPTSPVPTIPAQPCSVSVAGEVAAGSTVTLTCTYSGLATTYRFSILRSSTLAQTIYEGSDSVIQYTVSPDEAGCFKFQCLPISE